MSKKCTKCEVVKPLERYSRRGDGRASRCKDCTKEDREAASCPHGRQWSRCVECGGKQPIQAKCPHGKPKHYCVECGGEKQKCPCGEASQRTRCRTCGREYFLDGGAGKNIGHLKTDYGMYPYEYYFIRCLQNNACPLCDKPLVSGDIDIDHLHGTDIIRGLLHPNCNLTILGRLYEAIGRTDNPKFEEYKQRNPLGRNPSNDPPLVYNDGS